MEQQSIIVGWREWAALPGLGLGYLKAKIDSGAKTSALHAVNIRPFSEAGVPWVEFTPVPASKGAAHLCRAPIKDIRRVTDSGGHSEQRCVIETRLCLGGRELMIELTLTDRASMRFPMLLGRSALCQGFLIDSRLSYTQGGTSLRAPA